MSHTITFCGCAYPDWAVRLDIRFWHDPEKPRSCHCRCPEKLPKVKCLCCRKRFRPACYAELFCSLECFLKADHARFFHLLEKHNGDFKAVRRAFSKDTYNASPKGIKKKCGQNKRHYRKNRFRRIKLKPVSPDEFSAEQEPPPQLALLPQDHRCQRPGCDETISPKLFDDSGKRFCSVECRDAVRGKKATLQKAWKKYRCPVVYLALCFLKTFE